MSHSVGIVLLALVVPVGWGLLSAWLFDRWRAWRRHHREGGDGRSPEVAH